MVDITQFDEQRRYLILHKIKDTKHQAFEKVGPDYRHKGIRFQDDERILLELLKHIAIETSVKNHVDYFAANGKSLSLNSLEIIPYIEKAVNTVAGTDYYYTFEKDW